MDPSQMMNRSFPMWAPPPAPAAPPPHSDDPAAAPFLPPSNRGWKRKMPPAASGYQPPALGDLQVQNRAKARRWFKNPSNRKQQQHYSFFPNNNKNKAAAPRNTTSFIIRAKRAGGIASLVSPCPVTPAVLPTPRLSPSREGLADMAQAQWGVDGYGSMKGLIRLRASPRPASNSDDDENDDSSGGSDVEEHVEVERRLDHDLSRFEMVYPASTAGTGEDYLFQEDDDDYDQDAHVARLEEENLTLKERLFLMEQEVGDMRRRLEALEARFSLPSDAVAGGHPPPPPPPPENDVHVHLDTREEDKIGEEEYAGNEGSEKKVREKDVAGGSEKSDGQNAEIEGAEDSEKNDSAEKEGALVSEKIDSAEKEVHVISEKGNNAEKEGVVVSEKSNEHDAEMVDALVEQKSSEDDAEESRHQQESKRLKEDDGQQDSVGVGDTVHTRR